MRRVLVTWIGRADLRAPEQDGESRGPVGQAVEALDLDRVVLLSDYPRSRVRGYLRWLRGWSAAKVELRVEELSSPTDFGEIYQAAVRNVSGVIEEEGTEVELTFHLSPGTPAMAAVWIILSKTRFPAALVKSSLEQGLETEAIPLDLSADFLPDLLRRPDQELERLAQGLPPEAPEFDDIVTRSAGMRRLITKARRVAPRSVPVVIEGESGTGKELFARAIHRASPRRDAPFVTLNCGAIPSELVEATLFGHERGAFTGAVARRPGYFEEADRGTLFLDEVGELPLMAQVKLLRTLQEDEVTRVGATRPVPVDVRVVAATNRSLLAEVSGGRFRADLFYRLAGFYLKLPPLRERPGDVSLLIDRLLERINEQSRSEPGWVDHRLTAGARNRLLAHPWPGNVRELESTLRRAAVWAGEARIRAEDVDEALLPVPEVGGVGAGPGGAARAAVPPHRGDLPGLLGDIARHHLRHALDETGGNKSRAAEVLGLPSYQTLTNWMKKYGV